MRLMKLMKLVMVIMAVVLLSSCTTVSVTLMCEGDINLMIDGKLEYPTCEEWR